MTTPASLQSIHPEDRFILACLQRSPLPADPFSEPLLLHRMAYHRVTSMVYHHLLTSQQLNRLSAAAQQTLKERYQHNISRNLAIGYLAQEVAHTLNQRGIPALILKGAMFLQEFPDYVLMREMNDLDVMVKSHQLYDAASALAEIGFEDDIEFRSHRSTLRNWFKQRVDNALRLYGDTDLSASIVIELHWQLFPMTVNYTHWSMRALWQRSTHCPELGVHYLDRVDVLLHLCVHQCNVFDIFLYGLVDVANLLRVWGNELDWEAVIRRAKAQGILLHLVNILRLSHELVGAPLPPVYGDRLQQYETKAESGYALLVTWLLHKEMQPEHYGEHLPELKAFRQLEPFSWFAFSRRLTPRPLRRLVSQMLSSRSLQQS